jgi:N-acetylmuramoyl-L-alanine amidase CwlA
VDIADVFDKIKVVQDYVPVGNSNRPGGKITPSSITIHNTDNTGKGANAAAHAKYMKGADAQKRKVSWHYSVDDKYVYQSIPTNEETWHSGTKEGNKSSISIEICMNSDLDEAAAYDRAEWLVAVLCFRNGFNPSSAVFQHHDWSGKNCPRVLRGKTGAWDKFLDNILEKFSEIKQPKVVTLVASKSSRGSDDCENCA